MGAYRLTVYVVNYPLQYFAQRIAGEHAEVVLPVPPDVDPAFWMPDVATIAAYQRADLILLNGAQYAQWLTKVSLPQFRWEPDAVPSAAQWEQLRTLRRMHPVRWMIWEGEPAATTVNRLTAMGIQSLVFDPCANVPQHGDFLSVMRHNVANLTLAFQ